MACVSKLKIGHVWVFQGDKDLKLVHNNKEVVPEEQNLSFKAMSVPDQNPVENLRWAKEKQKVSKSLIIN